MIRTTTLAALLGSTLLSAAALGRTAREHDGRLSHARPELDPL